VGSRPKVAVVYHYFAHYREPIIRELLMQIAPEPEYVLISDVESNLDALRCVDAQGLAQSMGRDAVEWSFVKNVWIAGRFLWQRGLLKLVMSRDLDAIIYLGNVNFISTWIAVIASRISGKHVLMWTHGMRAPERGLKRLAKKAFFGLSHDLLLYGHRGEQLLVEAGLDSSKLHVIYNSLDYRRQVELQKGLSERTRSERCQSLFPNRHRPILLYIGRLLPEKRVELLIEAIRVLEDRKQLAVDVLVVGDGPALADVTACASKLGVEDRVVFYGSCYDEAVIAELIFASELCVVPGDVGLTAIHSLTYGTPVITHDDLDRQGPEFEAIVSGRTGALYRRGDVEDLADVVFRWLRDHPDSQTNRRNCMDVIAARYNPAVQVERINAAIRGRDLGAGS